MYVDRMQMTFVRKRPVDKIFDFSEPYDAGAHAAKTRFSARLRPNRSPEEPEFTGP